MSAAPRMWCEACREWHEDMTPGAMTATPWVPGCTGKVRHATAGAAVLVARTRHSRKVTPYPCRHCGGWHLSKTEPGRHSAMLAERTANALLRGAR